MNVLIGTRGASAEPRPVFFSFLRPGAAARFAARGVLATLLLSTVVGSAWAVPLVTGLGGVRDYGENVLPANDDGSTSAIDITSVFGPAGINFYGTNYTSLYVNNNGNVTFDGPSSVYSPPPMATSASALIGLWWGDVDTRGAHVPADSNLVYYDIDAVNGVVTVTWDLVGYFSSQADLLNAFQLRLIDQGSGDFDIEYRYAQLEWPVSGSPRAGYTAGNLTDYFEFAESGVAASMRDLVNRTNVDDPGRFVFEARGGGIQESGNGVVEGTEECDDGDLVNGDGCDSFGQIEYCINPPGSMAAWWSGDDTPNDISGNGHHGTLEPGVSYGAGQVGQAFEFDGSNNCVAVPDDPAFTLGTSDFTVDFWVRFDVLNDLGDILIAQNQGGSGWQIYSIGGVLLFLVDGGPTSIFDYPWARSADVWYHIAVTRSGVTDWRLYIDGQQVDTDSSSVSVTDSPAILTIGCSTANSIDGRMDEVHIAAEALSAAEIAGLYEIGSGGNCKNCAQAGVPAGAWCHDSPFCNGLYQCSGGAFGDGVIEAGEEECDDGNVADGDGCGALGQVEDCWNCSGEPSVCTAGAQLISTPVSTGDVGRYSAAALGADGLPIIVYYDATNQHIKVAHCNDVACTTATTSTVDTTVGDILLDDYDQSADIAIGGDGFAVMSYFSRTEQGLRVAHCNNTACTSSSAVTVDSGGARPGPSNTIQIGPDGFPLLMYGVHFSNNMKAMHCLNASCSSHTSGVSITGTGRWAYQHTTIGADGLGLILVGNGDFISSYHCDNADCSSATGTTLLTSGPGEWQAAQDTVLAPNGRGFFAFHDGVLGTLEVARCDDTNCTSISTSVVDGGVGVTTGEQAQTSIQFGSDDRARMAFLDADDDDLRFALCLDGDCSSSSTITLDSTGQVGRYASMVLSAGKPLVSYYDTTNGNLKVAYCSTGLGDGLIVGDEECDDGNLSNGDGCSATGEVETCYSCAGAPSSCSFTCGNGVVDPGEECDDGDLSSGDGCSATGTVEACYGCTGEPSVCADNCGSDGPLDPTFDTDGRVLTGFGAGAGNFVGVTFQSDGKVVAVGRAGIYPNFDLAVARYNDDGSPDTSFSGDGKLTLDFFGENDIAYDAAMQADGKIVVAGIAFNGSESYNVVVLRFLADGTLDTSFHGDGVKFGDYGGDDRAHGVAIQSDGKIVVGGMRGDGVSSDFLVARYNSDGTDDASFSGDGVDWLNVYGAYDQGNDVAIQADGKIIVAGLSVVGGNEDFSLVRYTTSGSLDTTFSGDGKLSVAVGSGNDSANAVAVQTNGRIVLAGYSHNGTNNDFAAVRCLANGTLDTSFGVAGRVTTEVGNGDDVPRGLAIRSDGKIVAGGYAQTSGDYDFAAVRYNTDGSLDTSFAGDGRATTAIGTGDDQGYAVGVDSSSRTVVAGYTFNGTDNILAIVRYSEAECGDGTLDAGEDCDDGNLSGGDCCSATCDFEGSGASCGSSSDTECDDPDTCDGSGTCQTNNAAALTNCGDAGTECTNQDKCDGSGGCTDNGFASGGTSCGSSSDTECDNPDTCDGSGTCQTNNAAALTNCGDAGTECTNQDKCDGSGGCTDNGFVSSGSSCGSSSDTECDNPDTCNGSGTCQPHFEAPTVNCGDAGTECTNQDKCNGSGSCTDNGYVADGSPCGSSTDTECDNPDTCNGSGTCDSRLEPPTTNCGDAGTDCTNQDKCSGSGSCTDNGYVAADTPCDDEPDECTNDRCNGAGVCQHTPIALAEVCNWAIVAGNENVGSKVRTRLSVAIGGGVCADKADVGVNTSLDDGTWAMQRNSGTTIRFRGATTVGTGSVATGGGCVKGAEGILDTGYNEICCEDGIIPLAGGGEVNACGTHADLTACTFARLQVAGDIALLDELPATQTLEALNCSLADPCTITAGPGLNVIDVPKVLIQTDSMLTIDGGGHADAVVILRTAKGMKGKPGASVLLAGGLDASRFAIYASDGSCKFGDGNVGNGTLFCPNGKVQFKLNTVWHGSIGAGSGVNLNDNAVLDHVPFLGLAD